MTITAYVADPTVATLLSGIADIEILTGADGSVPDDIERATVYVPKFLAGSPQGGILQRMPQLLLIQLLTAGAEVWIDKVPGGVTLCTARGAHGGATAEWAVGALIAVLQDFPQFIRHQLSGTWDQHVTDRLEGKRVLIVGAGDLGEQAQRRLLAFGAEVTMVARTKRDGVQAISNISALLPDHEVVMLMVPVTVATVGLVDADFLALMPDGAVLVNAARGVVVDTAALLTELQNGRLLAALDVTDPEPLPADHPLWTAPGVLITPHVGGSAPGALDRAATVVGAQLQRFARGEQLRNVVTGHGY